MLGDYPHAGLVADDEQWNPLADDGDALRLAVKLNMMEEEETVFELVEALH